MPVIMIERKRYYFLVFFLCLQTALLTGCKKEYSCEGCIPTTQLIIQHDSVFVPPVIITSFPACSLCKATDDIVLGKWNFKTGNTFLCGSVDAAGIDYAKIAFTFFGPSACSIDTGLVMTIYLPLALDGDRFNITTTKAAFFYYDNHAPKDIFISQPATLFSVTLESFIYATGIATGTFKGTVFKANGDTAVIKDGKFKVKVK